MSDYAKLKVTELKELLENRGLATTGKKDDLITRLTAADAEAEAAAKVEPHLAPPEDEFDWENLEDDAAKGGVAAEKPAAGEAAKKTAAAPAPAAANTMTTTADAAPEEQSDKKKFTFTRLADSFKTDDEKKADDKPAGTDTAAAAPAAEKPKEEEFSAHLATTKVDDELARRKARAARFGITVDDSVKLLERGLRFNASGAEGASDANAGASSKVVKGLDQALGDGRGRKRGPGGQHDNKGGNDRDRKRSRGNDGGQRRDNQPQQQQQKPKGILSDPTEKAKAEARAKRFG